LSGMAGCAVSPEPTSLSPKFPANREINREVTRFWPQFWFSTYIYDTKAVIYRQFP
jgi:hypothetical protein